MKTPPCSCSYVETELDGRRHVAPVPCWPDRQGVGWTGAVGKLRARV